MVMVTLGGHLCGNSTKVFGALHCSKYISQGIYSLAKKAMRGRERESKAERDEE